MVYDAVGGDYCEPAIRAMVWNGRYLVVGFPAGIPSLPLTLTLLKSVSAIGVFWGAAVMRDPAAHAANMADLLRFWEDGKILDPENGKNYSLRLTPIDGGKKLEVRGYFGAPLLGRTQTWIRVE